MKIRRVKVVLETERGDIHSFEYEAPMDVSFSINYDMHPLYLDGGISPADYQYDAEHFKLSVDRKLS